MTKQIIKTDYLDVFRIKDGVLLKVYKCNVISHIYCDYNKRKCTKLADNVYETKEPIILRAFGGENVIPAGAGIVENSWVEKLSDYRDFMIQLKTTGDCFSGDISAIKKYWNDIDSILESYK